MFSSQEKQIPFFPSFRVIFLFVNSFDSGYLDDNLASYHMIRKGMNYTLHGAVEGKAKIFTLSSTTTTPIATHGEAVL